MFVIVFLFLWPAMAFVVGLIGIGRNIGFFGAFFISLFFSPAIGLIVACLSKSQIQEAQEQRMFRMQAAQNAALKQIAEKDSGYSVVSELERLKKLKEEKLISDDEFEKLKSKIINHNPTI